MTAPLTAPTTSNQVYRSSVGPNQKSQDELRLEDLIILESCHATWVFDPVRMQFCRILKDIRVANRSVSTGWRRYWQVELDPKTEAFSVYLNGSRTRLIRSWRHTQHCGQCRGPGTTELKLEDIPPTFQGVDTTNCLRVFVR